MSDDNNDLENLFSGRRSFDRQLQLLTIAVHTLQRDFGVSNERLASMREQITQFNASVGELEDSLHNLDKALVARISTISVAERVLWVVIVTLVGLAAKFFG